MEVTARTWDSRRIAKARLHLKQLEKEYKGLPDEEMTREGPSAAHYIHRQVVREFSEKDTVTSDAFTVVASFIEDNGLLCQRTMLT